MLLYHIHGNTPYPIKHNSYITKYIPHPRRSKRRRTRQAKKNTNRRRTARQKAAQNATRHGRTRRRSARRREARQGSAGTEHARPADHEEPQTVSGSAAATWTKSISPRRTERRAEQRNAGSICGAWEALPPAADPKNTPRRCQRTVKGTFFLLWRARARSINSII